MPGAVPRGDDGWEGTRPGDRWFTRSQVLGRPWFLAACAGLGINDEVLKARYPGLVTGKASDVAGVVVVAAMASVVLGRRLAVLSTAVAFTALKTAPGIAEAVAPVLGGVTRRDATDVLAVLALAPMWRVGSRLPRAARAPGEPGPNAGVRPWGRPGRVVLCVAGAGASLFTVTATSAVREDAVVEVLADGPVVFARVASGYGKEGYWARSDDGGHSWTRGTEPAGARPWSEVDRRLRFGTHPFESFEASECGERLCVRLVYDEVAGDLSILASETGSNRWRVERRLTSTELGHLQFHCYCDLQAMGSLTVVRPSAETKEVAIAAGLTHGVLVRRPDGTWEKRRVLGANAPDPGASMGTRVRAVGAGVTGALATGVACVICARKGRPAMGLASLGLVGWAAALVAGAGMGLFAYSLDVFSAVVMIVTIGAVVLMALEFYQGFLGTPSAPPHRRFPPAPPPVRACAPPLGATTVPLAPATSRPVASSATPASARSADGWHGGGSDRRAAHRQPVAG